MTPEEVLMLAIQREGAATPDLGTAVAGGAALGTIGGMMAGNIARQPGRLLNAAVGRKPNRMKPGERFAGGLVGAILGGSLGAGTREVMINDSPAAALLAKSQAGGLSFADQALFEKVMREEYARMGIA